MSLLTTTAIKEPEGTYSNLSITTDDVNNIVWLVMTHEYKASFTFDLLNELDSFIDTASQEESNPFYVLSSSSKKVFNLGGDLLLFYNLISERDEKQLYGYMKKCIDTLYKINTLPSQDKIALVTGNAFGGGFEAALACDTIIAETNARFGFPERLFNLFPGMGAYNFLSRRIDASKAQKLIKSAKTYTAEELFDFGLVDKVVPEGEGHDAVYDHIHNYQRYSNSYNSLKQVYQTFSPIEYDDLLRIGELWVDCALRLDSKDIGLMKKLALSQANLTLNS